MLDNALEFLVLSGRDLAHAMMMLIPEAWDHDPLMRDEKKAFYQYHQSLMEPWDGPASIACTDGTRIAGVLDRNGLRPSRYWVTKDGFVVLSSECGVLPINPEDVQLQGAPAAGPHAADRHRRRAASSPTTRSRRTTRVASRTGEWLDENLTKLEDLPARRRDTRR